jgi:CRISPR-associated protein Cas2
MNTTLYIFTYDVSVTDPEGPGRLRRVARACESRGHRVQQSVFECQLNLAQFEALRQRLIDIMDLDLDSLRIYRINEPTDDNVEVYGLDHGIDFEAPLVF